MDPRQNEELDALLKDRLHEAFDSQIPNFGGYNLVYASGDSGAGGSFVLGFRAQPLELIVAPVDPRTHTALEPATSIDLTNVSHLAQLREAGYEFGLSTGRVFRFDVAPTPTLYLHKDGQKVQVQLRQENDCRELHAFLEGFMDHLDSIVEAAAAADSAQ
ncbi:hypothetical protein DWB68_06130 [Galactobacter valiniphilus]|uniref:Uncharacterized protein n=1 Tax=Galactobacter valiniphilus TaxID=2676122 RepID=A0A399JDT2_9MICC|nr:hypothetical protein [Galactobacter valiniphilus]RII42717.1 hypothetical protein DWB68_06130 [Galactobacter valiniphilus]